MKLTRLFYLAFFSAASLAANSHNDWQPARYPEAEAHAPSPLPERIVLTWTDDPATTQAVTWRTDNSILLGVAELAIANSNGRALKTKPYQATTTPFTSDLNEAHYHTVNFTSLVPDTLYTYRVGDGLNWSEFFHFWWILKRV